MKRVGNASQIYIRICLVYGTKIYHTFNDQDLIVSKYLGTNLELFRGLPGFSHYSIAAGQIS